VLAGLALRGKVTLAAQILRTTENQAAAGVALEQLVLQEIRLLTQAILAVTVAQVLRPVFPVLALRMLAVEEQGHQLLLRINLLGQRVAATAVVVAQEPQQQAQTAVLAAAAAQMVLLALLAVQAL
jgi:hypothetical protein